MVQLTDNVHPTGMIKNVSTSNANNFHSNHLFLNNLNQFLQLTNSEQSPKEGSSSPSPSSPVNVTSQSYNNYNRSHSICVPLQLHNSQPNKMDDTIEQPNVDLESNNISNKINSIGSKISDLLSEDGSLTSTRSRPISMPLDSSSPEMMNNLNRRNNIRDKTEGLNRLDNNQTNQSVITKQPSASLLNNVNLSILPNSGNYYELKQLGQSSHLNRTIINHEPSPSPNLIRRKIDYYDQTPPPNGSHHGSRKRGINVQPKHVSDPNLDPIDGIVSLLSAIYCKILVVAGLCFPMAEVISHRVPISWYEGFYLYLYSMSILFLIFVYIFLLNRKRKPFGSIKNCFSQLFVWLRRRRHRCRNNAKKSSPDCETEADHEANQSRTCSSSSIPSTSKDDSTTKEIQSFDHSFDPTQQLQCGSFYLRVGAVAFGVGSMIYSGLEFGQFFELESKENCYSFMYGLTPASHMIFTFIQLYFIFMNSRVVIARHKLIARFGLMHMIGTNICVWLHVLIQETKHQISTMVHTNSTSANDISPDWDRIDDKMEDISEDYLDSVSYHPTKTFPHHHLSSIDSAPTLSTFVTQVFTNLTSSLTSFTTASSSSTIINNHSRSIRSINDHYITHSNCRRSNVIGELVTDASQFLFPCTIEYSLICAAILYIMWKGINEMSIKASSAKMTQPNKQTTTTSLVHHQRHHYQVDCAKAHKGLFTGILLTVVCIISLILFFVFIKKDQYRNFAVLQAHIVELLIYCICAIACLIASFQVRELHYNRNRGVELDNILLIIAQSGLCIFTMFSIIGAQFISQLQNTRLVLINAFACLIQSMFQSVFILDASKRKASTADQVRRKPGREMVTFLLVCNFSMWAINTLETRRSDSNPVQMSFYGFWAWTIITHVTVPLAIFYRFHSTVCLCEIWKGTYKIKYEYI